MTSDRSALHLIPAESAPKLASFFRYVYDEFPFYRRRFDRTGLQRDDAPSSILDRIPVLSVPDYLLLQEELLRRSGKGHFLIDHTSGTTGGRKMKVATAEDDSAEASVSRKFFANCGITSGDRVLALDIDSADIYLFYERVLQSLGVCNNAFASASAVNRFGMDALSQLRPTALITVPSLLATLLRYGPKSQVQKALRSVRRVICIGERSSEALRTLLRTEYEVEVYSFYGTTEIGSIAGECAAHDGLHIYSESAIPTILDFSREGSVFAGEIVWTTLHFRDQPLIKYASHDFVTLTTSNCKCGDPRPRLLTIHRVHDEIVLYGHKIPYEIFWAVIESIVPPDGFFQIEVTETRGKVALTFAFPNELRKREKLLRERLMGIDELPSLAALRLLRGEVSFRKDPIKFGRKVPNVVDWRSRSDESGLLPRRGRDEGGGRSAYLRARR